MIAASTSTWPPPAENRNSATRIATGFFFDGAETEFKTFPATFPARCGKSGTFGLMLIARHEVADDMQRGVR